MSRRRELQFKRLCEEAGEIERARESGNLDEVEALLNLLRARCLLEEMAGESDPHRIEALADYAPDPTEAVGHYRRAIVLSERRSEPTYTKRIWIAARLIELGDKATARSELMYGRAEAERLGGHDAVAYADELLGKLAI